MPGRRQSTWEDMKAREHCWSTVLFSGLLLQQMTTNLVTYNNISSFSDRTGGQKHKISLIECHRLTCDPPPKFLCGVCVCVCVCVHAYSIAQNCPTLCDPLHCNLPGSSVHGISRQQYWSGLLFRICTGKRSGESTARRQSLQAGKRALPQNRILWYLELGLPANRSMRK